MSLLSRFLFPTDCEYAVVYLKRNFFRTMVRDIAFFKTKKEAIDFTKQENCLWIEIRSRGNNNQHKREVEI